MNWSPTETADVPPGVVTMTSTRPAACAGATAVAEVADTGVNDVAAVVPNDTAVRPVRFVPVIVTEVPPAVEPVVGDSDVTVGAGAANVTVEVSLPVPPVGLVAVRVFTIVLPAAASDTS